MRVKLKKPGYACIVFTSLLTLAVFLRSSPHKGKKSNRRESLCDRQNTSSGCRVLREAKSVYDLQVVVNQWKSDRSCSDLYTEFSAIYRLSTVVSNITVKHPFLAKVKSWLPGLSKDKIEQQSVISIFNRYTFEHSIINLIRSKRPGVSSGEDLDAYVDNLVRESSQNCDFCQYSRQTAENSFGRIESKYAVTAANVFPFDGYHGLIILKNHHPLRFSLEEFLDAMEVTRLWMRKGHAENPSYRFPHLTWDCLPKGSTSQVHSHAQVILSSVSHYGQMEHLKAAASRFEKDFPGEKYLDVLVQIHQHVNLSIGLGDAKALALVTPKKDDDMFIISPQPSNNFYTLLHAVLRAYIDDMKIYAWSMVIFYPTLDSSGDWDEGPIIARMISRGPATIMRSDISALELFAASNVNTDPFAVIKSIRKSIQRSGLKTDCNP